MNAQLIELVAANIAFVGTHFAMSHPLRKPLVGALGDMGFQIAYSLVSIVTLVWVYFAYKAAPSADLSGTGDTGWIIASILALISLVLFVGSIAGNPALPTPDAQKQARAGPKDMFLVTRHPMMWSFAIWAVSHIIVWANWRSVITAFAMGFLALVGAYLQDRKKRVLMGEAWVIWESKTSFWPNWGKLLSVGLLWWALGLMLWVLLTYVHITVGGVPAGIWRWF